MVRRGTQWYLHPFYPFLSGSPRTEMASGLLAQPLPPAPQGEPFVTVAQRIEDIRLLHPAEVGWLQRWVWIGQQGGRQFLFGHELDEGGIGPEVALIFQ